MTGLQPVPTSSSSPPPPPPSVRFSLPSQPDLGSPRECNIVSTYLHDPSLRYTKVPFAGPAPLRILAHGGGFLLGLALIVAPLVRQALLSEFSPWSLLAIAGIPLCLELFIPLRNTLLELHNRLRHRRMFRFLDLGLERAVPQPGTTLRYEVHLGAKKAVKLEAMHVRLVFWESWRAKGRLRFLKLPRRVTEKQGHDLVRHEVGPIELVKGQHAVVRGSIRVPPARPTEHHRGKPKHISYVNVTITLVSFGSRPAHAARGNCPHLVTFPWM
jgi:hypothetical protein